MQVPFEFEPMSMPEAETKTSIRDRISGVTPSARSLGAVLLVVVGLALAWQASLLREQRDAITNLENNAQRVAESLAAPVQQAHASVLAVLDDAQLQASLVGAGGIDFDAAEYRLQALLPDAKQVLVFGTSPEALLNADLSVVGYVRAAQLARAQSGAEASIGAIVGAGDSKALSVVEPIMHEQQTLAYAAVSLRFNPVADVFAAQPLVNGRFELRAGSDHGAVLYGRGHSSGQTIDTATPVPGSDLWLTTIRPSSRAWISDALSPWLVWALALLAVLAAGVLGWGQRLAQLPELVRRSERRAADAPTFAEVLDQEAGTAAAVRAKGGQPTALPEPAADVAVERGIFRAYDIRGVVGSTLSPAVARLIGRAVGSEGRERGQTGIVVGRDGRLSGPEMSAALIEGLRASGMDVIDIGPAPTPLVYFACHYLDTGSGVAITGSHNPPDYNGFKIVLGGETLAEDAIQSLYERISENRFSEGHGQLRSMDLARDYIERIVSDVQTERSLKVVVDCGNGIAGAVAPQVLSAIGCEVIPLHTEVDGTFPNHHPDPSDPDNLEDLRLSVKHQQADLGIAFDGDGDRLGVIDGQGQIIFPDRLLMLFATDVLERDPGATILYDVKCTGRLPAVILRHGGSPLMCKTGHSLVKAKMRETGAALAGEMSGHFFFQERWYGFDDAIYAAARLLEILAGDAQGRSPTEVFAKLPNGVSTPELKIPLAENEPHRFMQTFLKKATFDDARITTIDGMRADWADGWGLVRASNTTPVLVLRFDADSELALMRIQQDFREQLLAVNADLKLPF